MADKKASKATERHGECYEVWCKESGVSAFPPSVDSIAGYIFKFIADNNGSTRSVRNVKYYVKRYCEDKGGDWLSTTELRRLRELIREQEILDMSEGERKRALQKAEVHTADRG